MAPGIDDGVVVRVCGAEGDVPAAGRLEDDGSLEHPKRQRKRRNEKM